MRSSSSFNNSSRSTLKAYYTIRLRSANEVAFGGPRGLHTHVLRTKQGARRSAHQQLSGSQTALAFRR